MVRTCVILFLSCLILVSCKKGEKSSLPISGKWVESKDRADTIIFDTESCFLLLRGKELSSGHWLPKAWSGIYSYSVKSDTISVHYSFSSDSRQHKYVFNLQGNEITVGDFYQKYQPKGSVLKFTRLK